MNAVAPGVILTPLHERLTPPDTIAALVAQIPMGRLGGAEESGVFVSRQRRGRWVSVR